MRGSLFHVLEKEGLTRLTVGRDWRTGAVSLVSARTWDEDVDFSAYNRAFTVETPLAATAVCHGTEATRGLFQKHGMSDYLDAVLELVRQGRHAGIDCSFEPRRNIRFLNTVHSDTLGVNNRSHARRAGGIRRHELNEPEYEVIIDGLNLSRGMSFKNFAARIPYGGSKMTVMMDPVDLGDLGALGFLAYALDRSRAFTGPDMGFPPELADVLKANFTINITGGPGGPLGATGTPTAYGTYLAAKEAWRFLRGTASLHGVRIAVQGLGAVGLPLCEHYLGEGARLVVADVNDTLVIKLLARHPDEEIEVMAPEAIVFAEADIFSPCAIGGLFTRENIPTLRFKAIVGGANNQLEASSQVAECELAREMAAAGILFQVAWWHNLGGVLCGCEEYEQQENASLDRVLGCVEATARANTVQCLAESKEVGITPTEYAYRAAEAAIYRG